MTLALAVRHRQRVKRTRLDVAAHERNPAREAGPGGHAPARPAVGQDQGQDRAVAAVDRDQGKRNHTKAIIISIFLP